MASLDFHAPSLYLATGIIHTIAALFMLRMLQDRRDGFLGAWAGFAASYGSAGILCGLSDLLSPSLLFALAPPPALFGIGCLLFGARRLRGRPAHPALLAIPPGLWLLAGPAPSVPEQQQFLVAYQAIALPIYLGAAADCWRAHREQGLASARDLSLVLLAAAAWSGWRLAEGLLVAAQPFVPVAGLVTLILGASLAFLGLGVARERLAMAEAEALRRGRAEVERLHAGLPVTIFLQEFLADGSLRPIYRGGDVEAVTGWPREALDPLSDWTALAAPGTPFRETHMRAIRDGMATLEWQMRQPDGGHAWVRSSGRVLERRPDGSSLLVGYTANIDAERRAADAAALTQKELEATLAAAPLAVFRGHVGPDGSFTRSFLSRGIERLTGWSLEAADAPGALNGIMDPDKQAVIRSGLPALNRSGEARITHRIRRADGGWIWARTTMAVLERHPDGGAELVGYIADITAEREAEAKAVAAARLASLGEMASGLSHELMQPLLTLSLAAENAARALARGDTAAVGPRLERITQQVLRTKQLVEHFRRFARGTPEDLAPVPVDLAAAVEGALVLVGGALAEANIGVEVALGEVPPRILGQIVPLEQILVNLLGNARDAIEALPPDAPRRIRIEAGPGPRPDQVTLAVSDSGGGIPEAVLPRLFEPFVSTKGPDRGTGLGLSICRGMVKAMGGSIEARNEAAGARLTITLPAVPVAEIVLPAA